MRSLRCPFGGCERQSNERLDELSLIRNHRISVPRLDAALARGAGPQIRDRRDIPVDRDLSMTIRARGNDLKGTPGTSKIFDGEICGAARTLRHTVLIPDLSWYVNDGLWTGPSVVCMSGPSAGRRALKASRGIRPQRAAPSGVTTAKQEPRTAAGSLRPPNALAVCRRAMGAVSTGALLGGMDLAGRSARIIDHLRDRRDCCGLLQPPFQAH